jgi:hypothetical protein
MDSAMAEHCCLLSRMRNEVSRQIILLPGRNSEVLAGQR